MFHVFCSISHYLYWDHVGLIRWKIVVHAFVDGHSRMITAMHASNNNRAITVLDLFLDGVCFYGLPSWVRGDHGVENIQVAAFMEHHHGSGRHSYIFGRYAFFKLNLFTV